jgi:hypothetical protein
VKARCSDAQGAAAVQDAASDPVGERNSDAGVGGAVAARPHWAVTATATAAAASRRLGDIVRS